MADLDYETPQPRQPWRPPPSFRWIMLGVFLGLFLVFNLDGLSRTGRQVAGGVMSATGIITLRQWRRR